MQAEADIEAFLTEGVAPDLDPWGSLDHEGLKIELHEIDGTLLALVADVRGNRRGYVALDGALVVVLPDGARDRAGPVGPGRDAFRAALLTDLDARSVLTPEERDEKIAERRGQSAMLRVGILVVCVLAYFLYLTFG